MTRQMSTVARSTGRLRVIPIEKLHPHPHNPRISPDPRVIEGVAGCIKRAGEFPRRLALTVREVKDGFQVLSGHQRLQGALRAKVTQVPCWVVEMTDEEAQYELVLSNNQRALRPLEIGLHALQVIQLGDGGRGVKGGLADYARRVGIDKATIIRCRRAAKVFLAVKTGETSHQFRDKAAHLAVIGRAPQEQWPQLCRRLLAEQWSVARVKEEAAKVLPQPSAVVAATGPAVAAEDNAQATKGLAEPEGATETPAKETDKGRSGADREADRKTAAEPGGVTPTGKTEAVGRGGPVATAPATASAVKDNAGVTALPAAAERSEPRGVERVPVEESLSGVLGLVAGCVGALRKLPAAVETIPAIRGIVAKQVRTLRDELNVILRRLAPDDEKQND